MSVSPYTRFYAAGWPADSESERSTPVPLAGVPSGGTVTGWGVKVGVFCMSYVPKSGGFRCTTDTKHLENPDLGGYCISCVDR